MAHEVTVHYGLTEFGKRSIKLFCLNVCSQKDPSYVFKVSSTYISSFIVIIQCISLTVTWYRAPVCMWSVWTQCYNHVTCQSFCYILQWTNRNNKMGVLVNKWSADQQQSDINRLHHPRIGAFKPSSPTAPVDFNGKELY